MTAVGCASWQCSQGSLVVSSASANVRVISLIAVMAASLLVSQSLWADAILVGVCQEIPNRTFRGSYNMS